MRVGEERNCVCSQAPLRRAMLDGETYIEFKTDVPLRKYSKPLSFIILGIPLRNYFIEQVKAPLMKAIIRLGSGKLSWFTGLIAIIQIIRLIKKYPKPTRENTFYHNTHVLMDIFDRFEERFICDNRKELFKSARHIILAEMEHDIVYAYVMNFFVEEFAKEAEKGNWKLNEGGCPQKGIWKEE